MSEDVKNILMRKILGKACEKNKDACHLIHDLASGETSEDEVNEKAEEIICGDKSQEECDAEFSRLTQEIKEEDRQVYEE